MLLAKTTPPKQKVTVWSIVKQTLSSWSDDYAPSMGAALSYYTLFSIAPLLVIVISVAGLVFGEEAARGEIEAQLQGLMGNSSAKAVQDLLASASRPETGGVATLVGTLLLIFGATTVFGELQNALDRIWRAPAQAGSSGWIKLLRTRLLSFGLILGIGFMLMVSLLLSAALSAVGKWWGAAFGGWQMLASVLNAALSFGIVTLMFAVIYKVMPRVEVAWQDVWVGAVVTAALFTVGKQLIGMYIGRSDVTSGFGAAGSLVAMMVWVYYSAQIFLLGAEFTWVYAHCRGSRRGQQRPPSAIDTDITAQNPPPQPLSQPQLQPQQGPHQHALDRR